MRERADLQRLIRDKIGVLGPDLMVLDEEFTGWEKSLRRIDLLCLDKDANLVVVELKRTEDAGHSDLQSIRYAAMVSKMKFDEAVAAHTGYLERRGMVKEAQKAEESVLGFLEWDTADEGKFAERVRVILAAADFSKEVTTTVLWLREQEIDVRCVRIKPYRLDEKLMVDVEEIIPLPEAAHYLERIRRKERAERESRASEKDFTRFDVTVNGVLHPDLPKNRAMLCVAQGLVAAGVQTEEIAEAIGWKSETLWRSCEGKHTEQSFAHRVLEDPKRTFDRRRWFAREGELMFQAGRTYAMHSNWGGQQTIDWLHTLAQRWSKAGVEIRRHEEDPETEAA